MAKFRITNTNDNSVELALENTVLANVKQGEFIAKTVSSVANLMSTPTVGALNVLNYHSGIEGGGGVFYWDSNKLKSEHNGGTVIDPSKVFPSDWNDQVQLTNWFTGNNTGNGCWVRQYNIAVDVHLFGAKGDGVTDDTKSIQQTINLNSKVSLQQSSRYVCKPITLPDGVILDGNGGTLVFNSTGAIGVGSDTVIKNITVINNYNSECVGIDIRSNTKNIKILKNTFRCESNFNMQSVNVNSMGVENLIVEDNKFDSCAYGVLLNANAYDIKRVSIANNIFTSIYADGIELNFPIHLQGLGTVPRPLAAYSSGRNISIVGNVIEANPNSTNVPLMGVGIAGATNVSVVGNTIRFFDQGIHIEDEARSITISGNVIDRTRNTLDYNLPKYPYSDGIHILGGKYITVSGNAISGCAYNGINLQAGSQYPDLTYAVSENVTIVGNTIFTCSDNGIKITNPYPVKNNILISNNDIHTVTNNCIAILESSNNVVVSGNKMDDAAVGIYSSASNFTNIVRENFYGTLTTAYTKVSVGQCMGKVITLNTNNVPLLDTTTVPAGKAGASLSGFEYVINNVTLAGSATTDVPLFAVPTVFNGSIKVDVIHSNTVSGVTSMANLTYSSSGLVISNLVKDAFGALDTSSTTYVVTNGVLYIKIYSAYTTGLCALKVTFDGNYNVQI
jgi:hypothetical protein